MWITGDGSMRALQTWLHHERINMASSELITVEVAHALPDRQQILTVTVPADATIEQAITQSGILDQFPEIDLTTQKVGIFSQLKKLGDPLIAGDRIEIYRALIADPKESRRNRAKKAAEKAS